MKIKINVLELASELADLAVRREICDNESIEEEDGQWELIYIKNGNVINYTEKAQDNFNILYDYYYNTILKYESE